GDEPRAAAHLARVGQDRRLHHAFDPRGGLPRRPGRRHVAAPRAHRRRRDGRPGSPARSGHDGVRRLRKLYAEDPPPARAEGVARMSVVEDDGGAAEPLSAFAEFRRAPGAFIRQRPHLPLVPLVLVVFILTWEGIVRIWRVQEFLVPAPSAIARALAAG